MHKSLFLSALLLSASLPAASADTIGWVTTQDDQSFEGSLKTKSIRFLVEGRTREIPVKDLLTVQTGDPASAREQERITAGLAAVAGPDRRARDAAEAELTDLGLPVLTPLLSLYKDTDAREPQPLYRLFARIIPPYADAPDRSLDLVRLANGDALRGQLQGTELKLVDASGKEIRVPIATVRRLAVRRSEIRKTLDLQALHHTTPIAYLDCGISVTPGSRIEETARGFARLSFNIDGWSCDPDGLKVPGPNYKSNLFEGQPFGALVGKIGPAGERWLAGRHVEKTADAAGRLYFGINDNPHWQNNIGGYQVRLRVTDAYDLGDPQ